MFGYESTNTCTVFKMYVHYLLQIPHIAATLGMVNVCAHSELQIKFDTKPLLMLKGMFKFIQYFSMEYIII